MWDDSYDDSFSPVQQTKKKTNSVDFDALLGSPQVDNKKGRGGGGGKTKSKSQAFDADLLFSPSSASESNSPVGDRNSGGRGGDKEKKTYNFETNMFNDKKQDNYLSNFAANSGDLEDSILGELLGFGPPAGGAGAKKKGNDSLPMANNKANDPPASLGTGGRSGKSFSPPITSKLDPIDASPGMATSPVTTGIGRGQREGRGFSARGSRDYMLSNNSSSASPSPAKAPASSNAGTVEYTTNERQSSGVRGHFNSFDGGDDAGGLDSSNEFIAVKPPSSTLPSSRTDTNSLASRRSLKSEPPPSINAPTGATTSIPSFGGRLAGPSPRTVDPPDNSTATGGGGGYNPSGVGRSSMDDNADGDDGGGAGVGGGKGGFVPSFLDPGRQGRRRRMDGPPTAVSMDTGLSGFAKAATSNTTSSGGGLSKLDDLDAALGFGGPATAPKKTVFDPFAKVEPKAPLPTAKSAKPSFLSDSSDDSSDDKLKGKNRYDRASSFGSFVKQPSTSNNIANNTTTTAPVNNPSTTASTAANDNNTTKDQSGWGSSNNKPSSTTTAPVNNTNNTTNNSNNNTNNNAGSDVYSSSEFQSSKKLSSSTNALGPLPALSPKPASPQLRPGKQLQEQTAQKDPSSSDDELDISGIVKYDPKDFAISSTSNKKGFGTSANTSTKEVTTNKSDKGSTSTKSTEPVKDTSSTNNAATTTTKAADSPGSGIKLSRKTVGSTTSRTRPSTSRFGYGLEDSVDSSTDQIHMPTASITPAAALTNNKTFFGGQSESIQPASTTTSTTSSNVPNTSTVVTASDDKSTAPKALSMSAYLENLGSDDDEDIAPLAPPAARGSTLSRMNAVSTTNIVTPATTYTSPALSAATTTAPTAISVSSTVESRTETTRDRDRDAVSAKVQVERQNSQGNNRTVSIAPQPQLAMTDTSEDYGSTATPTINTGTSEKAIQMILEHSKAEKAAYERRMQEELENLRTRVLSYENLFQSQSQAAANSIHDRKAVDQVQLQVLQEQILRSEQEKLDLKRIIAQLEIEIHRLKDTNNILSAKKLEELQEIKEKHEIELKEKDTKQQIEIESIERRHGESISSMKKVHQDEINSYKDRLKSIETMETLASQIRQTTGSMKYLEEQLATRHRHVENIKEGQYEARERLIQEMEDKARERIEMAEGETFRLKGILSHMETMLQNARTQSYEEKERLAAESSRMSLLQEQLLLEKKVVQEQLQEERKQWMNKHKDLEEEISRFHTEKLQQLEEFQELQRKFEQEKLEIESYVKRSKQSLEHYEMRLMDEEKKILKSREDVAHERVLFEEYKVACAEEVRESEEVRRMLDQAMTILRERSNDIEIRENNVIKREKEVEYAEQQLLLQRQWLEEREGAVNEGLSALQVEASRLSSQEVQIGQCMRHIQQRNHELAVVESNVYTRKTQQAAIFREQIQHGILPTTATAASMPSSSAMIAIPPPLPPSAVMGFIPGMKWQSSLESNNPYRPGAVKEERTNTATTTANTNNANAAAAVAQNSSPASPIHDQFYFVNSVPPPPQLSSAASVARSHASSGNSSGGGGGGSPSMLTTSPLGRDENILNSSHAHGQHHHREGANMNETKKWSQQFHDDLKRVYSSAAGGNATSLLNAFNSASASSPSAAGAVLHGRHTQKDLPKEVRLAQRVMRENKIVLESVQSTSLSARRTLEADDTYLNSIKMKQRLANK